MKTRLAPFPDDFRFGVASADHQCEAYTAEGEDIRDVWERERGLVCRGRAADFWNRYEEDVQHAAALGCKAFRLSLSWTRLEPRPGVWDDDAFAHYLRVLECMRASGMETIVTLHHNTWPLHIQALGGDEGMLHESFPARFAAYATEVARRLGPQIDYYVTLNEPNQLLYGFVKPWWLRSYAVPPGLKRYATAAEQRDALFRLIPNLFRAHTLARHAIKAVDGKARVGANPLVFGFPKFVRSWFDRRATGIRSLDDLGRRFARVAKAGHVESSDVDISIAQITMTHKRSDEVSFSEAYFCVTYAVLGRARLPEPAHYRSWAGVIGVVETTTGETDSKRFFPSAEIRRFGDQDAALGALRAGAVDYVFGDDVMLRPDANTPFGLQRIPGSEQRYAVAVAPGKRSLLGAVDLALREFKAPDGTGVSKWSRSMRAGCIDDASPGPPLEGRRETLTSLSGPPPTMPLLLSANLDASLKKVRKRGVLRVGVHDDVPGLCWTDEKGIRQGLEPDIARFVASKIFGRGHGPVEFRSLGLKDRLGATRWRWTMLDTYFRAWAVYWSILPTNWWYLGMAGRLDECLCPRECVGAFDYVGVDYYWGINSFLPKQLRGFLAVIAGRYGEAPVWPQMLHACLQHLAEMFPARPIMVIENGCVTSADGFTRESYLRSHIAEVQRAVAGGVRVAAYLCWSITSNREWGYAFDDQSDFGLFHIALDTDPHLTRIITPAARAYRAIIATRSAQA